jgi:hypothetical protein
MDLERLYIHIIGLVERNAILAPLSQYYSVRQRLYRKLDVHCVPPCMSIYIFLLYHYTGNIPAHGELSNDNAIGTSLALLYTHL